MARSEVQEGERGIILDPASPDKRERAGAAAQMELARVRAAADTLALMLESFAYDDGCNGGVPYCARGEETCRWCKARDTLAAYRADHPKPSVAELVEHSREIGEGMRVAGDAAVGHLRAAADELREKGTT